MAERFFLHLGESCILFLMLKFMTAVLGFRCVDFYCLTGSETAEDFPHLLHDELTYLVIVTFGSIQMTIMLSFSFLTPLQTIEHHAGSFLRTKPSHARQQVFLLTL